MADEKQANDDLELTQEPVQTKPEPPVDLVAVLSDVDQHFRDIYPSGPQAAFGDPALQRMWIRVRTAIEKSRK